jgi:HEAT repeat protein
MGQFNIFRPATRAGANCLAVSARCFALACGLLLLTLLPGACSAQAQSQSEIDRQRQRLSSAETEERRDAVMRLGQMKRPDASRLTAPALTDSAAIVRATAARAVLSLPPDEAAALLIPLLKDKDEFARREAAYALGETRSRRGVQPLMEILAGDKQESVRSSAAVALGQIGDESAVVPLTQVFDRSLKVSSGFLRRKKRIPENEFVRRAAARSLGQIGSRAGVPALISVLSNERTEPDVRREAARALGLIGDPAATSALRAALTSTDPYLSRIAYEALRKMAPAQAARPT